jgi:hypothetical protein
VPGGWRSATLQHLGVPRNDSRLHRFNRISILDSKKCVAVRRIARHLEPPPNLGVIPAKAFGAAHESPAFIDKLKSLDHGTLGCLIHQPNLGRCAIEAANGGFVQATTSNPS